MEVEPGRSPVESDHLYRIRRDLEDKVRNAAEEHTNAKIAKLQWRYGSVIAGLAIGGALLGFTTIQDIPKKIDEALRSESSLKIIEGMKAKEEELEEVYTKCFNLLKALETNYQLVSSQVANSLKTDTHFLNRTQGEKGAQGERGERGSIGPQGPPGPPGEKGIDGLYSNLPKSTEIGKLEIQQDNSSHSIILAELGSYKFEFVIYFLGSSFNPPWVAPEKVGSRFIYEFSNIRRRCEVWAIAYYRRNASEPAIVYIYSAFVNP